MTRFSNDLPSGIFFILVGLLFGGIAWLKLPIGQMLNMGPGFFPIVLSAMMVLIGLVLAGRAILDPRHTPFGVVPWRGVVLISVSIVLFALLLTRIGLFPAVLLSTFVACLSGPGVTLKRALAIAVCVAAFCVLVFAYGVGLPVPIVGPWLAPWLAPWLGGS